MIPFQEYERIFNDVKSVFKPNQKDPIKKWLHPGKHEYKFSYQLPRSIPYSIDGAKYGQIEYKSKAEVNVLNSRRVESLEEEFFIHSDLVSNLCCAVNTVIRLLTVVAVGGGPGGGVTAGRCLAAPPER